MTTAYEAYLNGRREMKVTVESAIEPVVKHDKRSISEMELYARTLNQEQLVTLAMAMQSLVNNVLYEIQAVR